jgi:uncharacterized protein YukE
MQTIYVDTEQLYRTARTCWQNDLDMVDQVSLLRTTMIRLEMAWQGSTSEEFQSEMALLIQQLDNRAEELVSMGFTLSRQGEIWDESDQRWTRNYGSIIR